MTGRIGTLRRTASAHSSRTAPSDSPSCTQTNTMPDLRCPAIRSITSTGMPGVFTRRPITSTSGILPLPAPIAVFAPQQREHRDRGDVVDQSLLEFGRYRRLRHEQSLRQRALLLGNRRRGRQSQRQGGYLAAVCDGQVCSSHHRPPCVRLRRQPPVRIAPILTPSGRPPGMIVTKR